jgi:hypothetical protein
MSERRLRTTQPNPAMRTGVSILRKANALDSTNAKRSPMTLRADLQEAKIVRTPIAAATRAAGYSRSRKTRRDRKVRNSKNSPVQTMAM